MNKFLIILEKSKTGFSAYSPDVDGCIAIGDTIQECRNNMEEALKFHIDLMLEKGYDIPIPTTRSADFVKINLFKNKRKELAVM